MDTQTHLMHVTEKLEIAEHREVKGQKEFTGVIAYFVTAPGFYRFPSNKEFFDSVQVGSTYRLSATLLPVEQKEITTNPEILPPNKKEKK